jgi:FdhD protein
MARRFDLPDGGRRPQEVVVEEPLEIHFGDELRATTMRTPGHDFELAVGWLWAEGSLTGPPREVRYCGEGSASETHFNVVTVQADAAARLGGADAGATRLGTSRSSWAPCGADQLERLAGRLTPLPPRIWRAEALATLGEALVERQGLFSRTGGAHGAAAFDLVGEPVVVREDVGRHNAIDKVVGRLLLDSCLPVTGWALWTSGRVSFQMVQKAWAAGFGALVSVSAPSSLAVRAAERAGMVLVGFARQGGGTVYAGDGQVRTDSGGG